MGMRPLLCIELYNNIYFFPVAWQWAVLVRVARRHVRARAYMVGYDSRWACRRLGACAIRGDDLGCFVVADRFFRFGKHGFFGYAVYGRYYS